MILTMPLSDLFGLTETTSNAGTLTSAITRNHTNLFLLAHTYGKSILFTKTMPSNCRFFGYFPLDFGEGVHIRTSAFICGQSPDGAFRCQVPLTLGRYDVGIFDKVDSPRTLGCHKILSPLNYL